MKRGKIKSEAGHQISKVTDRLLIVFRSHVGIINAISQSDLFVELTGHKPTSKLEDWVRWELIKKAMHRLRKETKCFVISKRTINTFIYFVPSTIPEAKIYVNNLNSTIESIKTMQSKAILSVKKKWYKSF